MTPKGKTIETLELLPLTPERWSDFEKVFGPYGASSGCWCMFWRLGKEYNSSKGASNKAAMKTLVQSGVETGLIAYADGEPAAWVTVAPRADYVRLATSKHLYPVDDQPVWSIPCFFVHRNYRGSHLMGELINGAVEYARQHGAKIIEAYPIDIHEKTSSGNLYTGVQSAFEKCGFTEIARREDRPILRKTI